MALGYWVYDWQKNGGHPKKLQKYRFLYWSLFPLGCLCCYSGTIFYSYAEPPSFTVHMLYAVFMKPVFAFIVCAIMAGVIIQFEDIYRPILEWPTWTVSSRLSFSAYLLHFAFLRNFIGMQTTTFKASVTVVVTRSTMILTSSFIAAFFFWMLVESPFGNLIREVLTTPGPDETNKEVDEETKNKEDARKEKEHPNKNDKSLKKKKVVKIVDNVSISTKEEENKILDKIPYKMIEKK